MLTARTRTLLLSAISALSLAPPALAGTADITIKDAKIAAGKLVISGVTATPNMKLRLDGRTEAEFNTTSKANRSFSLSLVYLPRDCIVSMEKMSLGKADRTQLVVANCAPSRFTPRGDWNKSSAYQMTDVVSFEGQSWLATADNSGQIPGKNSAWQLFAAKGQQGHDEANGSATQASSFMSTETQTTRILAAASAQRATPSGPAGGDLTGTYPNPQIKASAVGTTEIKDFSIATTKIKNKAVTNAKLNDNAVSDTKIRTGAVLTDKIADGAITSAKVLDGNQVGGGLNSEDINPLHGDIDIQDNTITTFDIATDAVDSDEVLDFGLSNQDIGVLFAQINADGSLANSSGSVASISLGTGTYQVDFGRDISSCAPVATQGEAGVGGAGGAIMGVTDRSGNANAVFVTSRSNTGTLTNAAFHLVLVC